MRLASALVGGEQYVSLALCAASSFSFGLNGEIGTLTMWFKSPDNPFSREFTDEFGPALLALACQQEITVDDADGIRRFGGRVAKFSKGLMGKVGVLYQIDCQDYMALLDSLTVISGLTVTSSIFTPQTDKSIIEALFSQLAPDWDLTHVHAVTNIPEANYEGKSLLAVLQDIRQVTGAHFFCFPGYKRLYYFAEGEYKAAFELDELANGLAGFRAGDLFGSGGIFGGDTIFGGSDLSEVKAVQWLQSGMRYEKEAARAANRVTVRGEWVEDIVNLHYVATPTPDASLDGYAGQRKSVAWPPVLFSPGEGAYYDRNEVEGVARQTRYTEGEFTYYDASCIVLQFDTGALEIPSDATIESVTLQCSGALINNDFLYGTDATIGIEYVTPGVIFESFYTDVQGNSAWGFAYPTWISGSGTMNFLLRNLENINRAGTTALRIHLKLSAAPQEVNEFRVNMQEAAGLGLVVPSLQIAYRTVQTGNRIQVTVEDSAAIAALHTATDDGVRPRYLRYPAIKTEALATLRAQYELNQFATPKTNGALSLLREGLEIGQVVRINSPSLGFDETHLITKRTMNWFGNSNLITLTGIEFGQYRPGFEIAMKRMERALKESGAL